MLIDKASKEKTMELIDRGERVFIWPEKLKKYKDFNDICINFEINEISNKFIIDNQGISDVRADAFRITLRRSCPQRRKNGCHKLSPSVFPVQEIVTTFYESQRGLPKC